MRRGFTLIEVLVVVTIVGLLSTIGIVSYSQFSKQSRDAKRKSDLQQIKAAVEMFRTDNDFYPTSYGTPGLSFGTGNLTNSDGQVYMGKLPQNPKGNSYIYTSNGNSFCLSSPLENGSYYELDPYGESSCYSLTPTPTNIPTNTPIPATNTPTATPTSTPIPPTPTPVFAGNGADGAVVISSNKNINTDTIAAGRNCADGVNFSVTSLTANTATLSSSTANCFNNGDEILLINLQGTSSNYTNVGNYETLRIQSIAGPNITFTTSKTKYYGNNAADDTNIGTSTNNQRVMLQRIPNYTNVTINSGVTLTASAWDGTRNGVLGFKANGTFTNNGTINMSKKGFRGGTVTASGGCMYYSGTYSLPEGYQGFMAIGGGDGGYSGVGETGGSPNYYGGNGSGGGGAGGGGNGASGGTACGTSCRGGGGAGGGAGSTGGAGYNSGGNGSGCGGRGGSGGGASYNAGASSTPSDAAKMQLGGGASQGAGGGAEFGTTGGHATGLAAIQADPSVDNCAGGTGGSGENGGGIIYIAAITLNNAGNIRAGGGNGGLGGYGGSAECHESSPDGGGGGGSGGNGGSGGPIVLMGNSLTLGSNTVSSPSGSGGSGGSGKPGISCHWNEGDCNDGSAGASGAGSAGSAGTSGKIAIYYKTSVNGTTNPAAYIQQF